MPMHAILFAGDARDSTASRSRRPQSRTAFIGHTCCHVSALLTSCHHFATRPPLANISAAVKGAVGLPRHANINISQTATQASATSPILSMSVSWSRKYYRRMVNLKTPSVLFHTLALSNSTFISLKVACIISFPSCKHSIRQPPLVMSDNLTTKIFRLRTYTCMHALYTIRPTLPKTHIPRASSTPLEHPQLLVRSIVQARGARVSRFTR